MIEEYLQPKLQALGLSLESFSELTLRLLDYGVIHREESQIEAQLYDRFLQCHELVEDYLAILHLRLQHDRQFAFVRVFPPGAEVPGLADNDSGPYNAGLRYRPSQQEVALILVLRVEYENALREGRVDDRGCVMIAFEAVTFAMKNLLKRNLPENALERKALFKRLRQMRLIRFNQEDAFESGESWLSIQPDITSFVTAEALGELYPHSTSDEHEDTADVL